MDTHQPNISLTGTITAINELTSEVFEMFLEVPGMAPTAPGQFVNLSIPGFFLRRPLAIARRNGDEISVIVQKVGGGTRALGELRPGTEISLLGPLGNGFDMSKAGERPVLVGGGAGIPPLLYLASALVAAGTTPVVCLGYRNEAAVFSAQDFAHLGCDVRITTEDGSVGERGYVTAVMPAASENPTQVYSCGPEGMLRAVKAHATCPLELSLEAHMGCGFGACLGCAIPTTRGLERVCVEGPVFDGADVLLEEVA
ncbi:MAG: dihydroorotate dehydrogenase electron transfer subunit [Actinomycetaceae bacterium]|nr:dihydroorotate dehydrogenase electron transfer subunit [Actinomycetaceae bacterium]